jgi:hypothetical protein
VVPGRVRSLIYVFKLRWAYLEFVESEKVLKRDGRRKTADPYRRNVKGERITRFCRPPLDQRHQCIAWLPGLWRVCSRVRIVCSRRRRPSSSPEDRISRSIWVISLSSSIDLRRSAGLSISLFFAMVYEQERRAKDTPGRKTWKCIASAAPPTDNLTIDGVEIVNQWHFRRERVQRTSLRQGLQKQKTKSD